MTRLPNNPLSSNKDSSGDFGLYLTVTGFPSACSCNFSAVFLSSAMNAKRPQKRLGHPKWKVTDSSNALIPFQAICTPIQTRKNDDNCVITVMPVAPRIRARRSANP